MTKLLLALAVTSNVVHADPAATYKTEPIGVFSAPKSALAAPDEEDRSRLYVEGIIPVGNAETKGKWADLAERRPPVILRSAWLSTSDSRDDRPFTDYDSTVLPDIKVQPGEVLLANFRHLDKYYVALIPTFHVESLDLGYVKFMPIAAHFLTFFNFATGNPVKLIAVLPTLEERQKGVGIRMLDKPIELDNLILSIEGTNALGAPGYDLLRGMQGYLTNSFKITNVQDQYLDYLRSGYPKKRYRSKFNLVQTQRILMEALHSADRSGLEIEYHTLNSNCTNRATEIFERAVGKNLIANILAPIGKIYPLAHEYEGSVLRGYRDVGSELPNMEDEPKYQAEFEQIRAQFGLAAPAK